jgi:hypothetical protein
LSADKIVRMMNMVCLSAKKSAHLAAIVIIRFAFANFLSYNGSVVICWNIHHVSHRNRFLSV